MQEKTNAAAYGALRPLWPVPSPLPAGRPAGDCQAMGEGPCDQTTIIIVCGGFHTEASRLAATCKPSSATIARYSATSGPSGSMPYGSPVMMIRSPSRHAIG